MIKKIIIQNFKSFEHFTLELNEDLNIIVGDNEMGKSTILEAINLALTKRLNGRLIEYELSPYLFNSNEVGSFLSELRDGKKPQPPIIFIELYLNNHDDFADFRGTNNSLNEDEQGFCLEISFNEEFTDEYEELLSDPAQIELLPTEYFKVRWLSFAGHGLTSRSIPIGISFIDATTIRLQSGTDRYLQTIINDGLDTKEKVELSVAYRGLKEEFAKQHAITEINKKLDQKKGEITDKELSIAIDVSQKANWETNLVPHLDQLPFQFSGRGEQSSLKIMLALDKTAEESNIVLIEEPENHLSFSSMNILLERIASKSSDKQIVVCTHSSFVLNKLGLEKLILVSKGKNTRLGNLSKGTQNYFKKLSGYDTLRLVLAKKAILVEGPSDELVVQKSFHLTHGKLPIENGVDVINVRGLSFLRFLEIARELDIEVVVVTDNDGDFESKIQKKYKDYLGLANVSICYDTDNNLPTLEPQFVEVNELDTMNNILDKAFSDKGQLLSYMQDNKTEWALKLFETEEPIVIPKYIQDATK